MDVIGPVSKEPRKPLTLVVPSMEERAAAMLSQTQKVNASGPAEAPSCAASIVSSSGGSTSQASENESTTSGSTPTLTTPESVFLANDVLLAIKSLERFPTHHERHERYSARLARWHLASTALATNASA